MSRRKNESVTVNADTNQATDPLFLEKGEAASISIIGASFVGTITAQSKVDGVNWEDVDSWTTDTRKSFYADEAGELRLICKTGDWTSGSAVCRVGR